MQEPANRIEGSIRNDGLLVTSVAPTSRIDVYGDNGQLLIRINTDGSVEGSVEHANEAGRRFVEGVRKYLQDILL